MSRMSIRTFLSNAKEALSQSLGSKGERPAAFVIGNESADLDSITCALVYGYLQLGDREFREGDKYVIPVANIPSAQLRLRPELTALLRHAQLKPSDLVTLDDLSNIRDSLPPEKSEWTLVDHNGFQGSLGERYKDRVVGVIDHHEDEEKVPKNAKIRIIEKSGSCNSLVVNSCQSLWDSLSASHGTSNKSQGTGEDRESQWDAEVAKLALGSILIDTVNLKAEQKVTEHDRKAVEYLEAKIRSAPGHAADYNRDAFFKEINDAKSNLDSLSLEDILYKDYKQWTEGKLTLGISSVVKPIEYLETKVEKLAPALLQFAKEKELDLFAVMTAHNDSGTFERQMTLFAMSSGPATDAADEFMKRNVEELQLQESDAQFETASEACWCHKWEQKNLEASRKKVAPLLRQAMKSYNEAHL